MQNSDKSQVVTLGLGEMELLREIFLDIHIKEIYSLNYRGLKEL